MPGQPQARRHVPASASPLAHRGRRAAAAASAHGRPRRARLTARPVRGETKARSSVPPVTAQAERSRPKPSSCQEQQLEADVGLGPVLVSATIVSSRRNRPAKSRGCGSRSGQALVDQRRGGGQGQRAAAGRSSSRRRGAACGSTREVPELLGQPRPPAQPGGGCRAAAAAAPAGPRRPCTRPACRPCSKVSATRIESVLAVRPRRSAPARRPAIPSRRRLQARTGRGLRRRRREGGDGQGRAQASTRLRVSSAVARLRPDDRRMDQPWNNCNQAPSLAEVNVAATGRRRPPTTPSRRNGRAA